MVTLNLDTTEREMPLPTGGTFVHGMSDLEFIEKEVQAWLNSEELKNQLDGERYYDGLHDILDRKITMVDEDGALVELPYMPNHKIVDNVYAKYIDQKANYLLGKPFVFDCEDKALEERLHKFFDDALRRKLKAVAVEALIGGKAWIMPFYGKNNTMEFSVLSASSVRPFWADSAHTRLDCALHMYEIEEYTEKREKQRVTKLEVLHGGGMDRFIYKDGALMRDPDAESGAYINIDGKPYNWSTVPLICFKANSKEQPLLNRVRSQQDQLNLKTSDLMNALSATVYNSVIVLENYDGEDTRSTRKNIMTTGIIKVRTLDGIKGDARILKMDVDVEGYKKAIDLLKQSILDNARGHDAKDDRLGASPNKMNIQSMYSDTDLDANGMEVEFKAAIRELLEFISHDMNIRGMGGFDASKVDVIFNRDIIVNESQAIEDCTKSVGILSDETITKNHPWTSDVTAEQKRKSAEREKEASVYSDAFSMPSISGEAHE